MFQVICRYGPVIHGYLHPAGKIHLVGVDPGPQSVPEGCREDPFCFVDCKEACFTKHIHIPGQLFFSYPGDHFFYDQVYISGLVPLILFRNRMRPQKGCPYRQGRLLSYPSDDTQHFQFVLNGKAIAAFYFNRPCAKADQFPGPYQALPVKLFFRCFTQQAGGIENAASACRYFLIRQSAYFICEFLFPAPGINNMRMAITKGRKNTFSGCINDRGSERYVFTIGIPFHGAESVNHPVPYEQPGIFNTRQPVHPMTPAP